MTWQDDADTAKRETAYESGYRAMKAIQAAVEQHEGLIYQYKDDPTVLAYAFAGAIAGYDDLDVRQVQLHGLLEMVARTGMTEPAALEATVRAILREHGVPV